MRGRRRERIEATVDRAAAASLAVAVAFSLLVALSGMVARPQLAVGAIAAALAVYALTARFLRSVGPTAPRLPLRVFTPADLRFDEPEELLLTEQVELVLTEQVELVLTDADRLKPAKAAGGELALDDILAQLGPKARVVRLFDPVAMPTPGQLSDRIERHLRADDTPARLADASEALYQALNELRRSLH
jgi:hypothetical protein